MTTTRIGRRRLAATATLLLVPTLAACGFGAQTNQQYQSAAGTDSDQATKVDGVAVDNTGSPIQVYNAAIVVDQVPSSTATAPVDGVFVGTFVNNSAPDPAQGYDATTGALSSNGVTATVQSMSVTSPAGSTTPINLTLNPNTSYKPQPFSCGTGEYGLKVQIPANLVQGQNIANDGAYVTMKFAIAPTGKAPQTITMSVPVFPKDGAGDVFAPFFETATAAAAPGDCPTQTALPEASAIAAPAGASSTTTPTSTSSATATPTP